MIESSAVKQYSKLGSILTENIRTQVEDYSERLSPLGGLYKGFIEDLIFTDLDTEKAAETASQLFGTEKCSFAAIDGTEYTSRMFDLVVFFGGSYSAKGTIDLSQNPPSVEYSTKLME